MEIMPDYLSNDSCDAWQADHLEIPGPLLSAIDNSHFFLAFAIKFILPPAYQVEDEDDYLLVVPDIESRTTFYRIWAPCRFLERDNMTWKEISELLTRFSVPLHKQPFMVNHIAACVDEVANVACNRRRRVLPIWVTINVVVDYCVTELDGHSPFIKKAKKFSDMVDVPANEASIQALEKEKIEETGSVNRCMVCLEGLRIGSEARRMPCKHAFHQTCIFNWLRVAGFCPVCYFYLPAT